MNNACAARSMNLVIVFALLAAIAVAAVSTVLMMNLGSAGSRALEERAGIVTRDISVVLGDPFAMGEYDHMGAILAACKLSDPALSYASVVSSDGRIVASTDASKQGVMLNGSEYDKAALSATDLVVRAGNSDPDTLETAIPIKTAAGKAGVLRMGYSVKSAIASVRDTTSMVCLVAFLAVLVCTLIFAGIAKNWVPAAPAGKD